MCIFLVFMCSHSFAGERKTLTVLYTGDMAGKLKPVPQ